MVTKILNGSKIVTKKPKSQYQTQPASNERRPTAVRIFFTTDRNDKYTPKALTASLTTVDDKVLGYLFPNNVRTDPLLTEEKKTNFKLYSEETPPWNVQDSFSYPPENR